MISKYKVVVLGQGRVGKTSIALKYIHNQFDVEQKSTINASFLQKKIELERGENIQLAIWDTAGQEQFNSVAPLYYKDASGAIIVYDITSRQSFEKVRKWVQQLQENGPQNIVLMIAGNKADLEHARQVNQAQVDAFAKKQGGQHWIVSAKNGANIADMFMDLGERIHASNKIKKSGSKRSGPKLTVEKMRRESKEQKKESKCCN